MNNYTLKIYMKKQTKEKKGNPKEKNQIENFYD